MPCSYCTAFRAPELTGPPRRSDGSGAVNPQVNAIAGRLSLRPPQRRALEILDRITEIVPLQKDADVANALAVIRSEYPTVTDFERDFPSVCFALATGVGKTRLMGAFISYLHLAHGVDNFFVLAPNLTIYQKLIADFTPNTPKYVFKGIAAFATTPPEVITGDNYESRGTLLSQLVSCKINIFNISKINSEVRGGRAPRIKRLSEYIGESYFDYLAGLPDLVLLMDESHRYRASAGVRAINELKPMLGLELTATPFVETNRGPAPFHNVVLDYPLGQAMADGFVKEPAVVTRKDFNPVGMPQPELERLKLEDGIRIHEQTKVLLDTYARENDVPFVKPFMLVIARDTTHARELVELVSGSDFFGGRYAEKVIQVDSSRSGAEEDEMVERLLRVEQADEPTEIVVHVNMLKEGWDVTNLYTIVPLRAANARTLIEQSIGRGLRLPYGKRTGVPAVDRLNIIAHDKFQELIDEANRPDSVVRLQQVVLTDEDLTTKTRTVIAPSTLETRLGLAPRQPGVLEQVADGDDGAVFHDPREQEIAKVAWRVIRQLERRPNDVPSVSYLNEPEVQELVLREVREQYVVSQPTLAGLGPEPDLAAVVAKTAEMVVQGTIAIPRIIVVPKGEVRSGFRRFKLDLSGVNNQPMSDDLWLEYLRTNANEVLTSSGRGLMREPRLENYIVAALIEFDDVAYDENADLLYDLAGQVVLHLQGYLDDDGVLGVLRQYQRELASHVHAQMEEHYWEDDTVEYETKVSRGFTALKETAFTQSAPTLDFRNSPAEKSNMGKYLFGGFQHCLYPVAKFDSDTERTLAVILERDALKWFRPAKGQFQIYYRWHGQQPEYQPDFVAETDDGIYLLEPKRKSEMDDSEVLAKRDAAVAWCRRASEYTATYGGKPWTYALIPHDAIASNMTLKGLVERWGAK